MSIPGMRPESEWPSGDMPVELRKVMRAEGIEIPEEIGGPPDLHQRVNGGPPRAIDAAGLEAERQAALRDGMIGGSEGGSAGVGAPMQDEGDALIARLRRQYAKPTPATPPPAAAAPSGAMVYDMPLRPGRHAHIMLTGDIGPEDVKLLVRYLKLTAETLNNASLPEKHSVPEQHPHGRAEAMRAQRHAAGNRNRKP